VQCNTDQGTDQLKLVSAVKTVPMATPHIVLHCPSCGYCLHGLEQRVCPECGRGFDPKRPHDSLVRLQRRNDFIAAIIGVTCALASAGYSVTIISATMTAALHNDGDRIRPVYALYSDPMTPVYFAMICPGLVLLAYYSRAQRWLAQIARVLCIAATAFYFICEIQIVIAYG